MMKKPDLTKKELEEAIKDGRAEVLHVLGAAGNKVSKDDLLKILWNAREYICVDGEHYCEHDIDLKAIFDLEDYLDECSAMEDEAGRTKGNAQ